MFINILNKKKINKKLVYLKKLKKIKKQKILVLKTEKEIKKNKFRFKNFKNSENK
jgi:hypothetical protein